MPSHVPCREACVPDTLTGSPEQREFHDMLLTPGRRFDLADLSPAALAKLAQLQHEAAERAKSDWPNLCKYIVRNEALVASGRRPEAVFFGDSITENWAPADPSFFNADTVNRGIGGQTTSQLLLRVYPDVVALRPRIVHLMAGSNDIAGNTGPVSDDTITDNIRAMIDIAQANHIQVIIGSVPPAKAYSWSAELKPARRVMDLNLRLRALAGERGAGWVDYHAALTDAEGGLQRALGNDGVHPNRDGYSVMRPLAELALREARSGLADGR